MKKEYEIYLMQHVTGSVDNDWETVAYIPEYSYNNYFGFKRAAKELSLHYGEEHIRFEGHQFDFQGGKDGYRSLTLVSRW